MTIKMGADRQSPLFASVDFTLADLVSGTFESAVSLPENAEVTGGSVVITTAFDSVTTDAMEVGDVGSAGRYLAVAALVDALPVGRTPLVPTGFRTVGREPVGITWTGVGGTTAGAGRLEVEYTIVGRSMNIQP